MVVEAMETVATVQLEIAIVQTVVIAVVAVMVAEMLLMLVEITETVPIELAAAVVVNNRTLTRKNMGCSFAGWSLA